MAGVRIASNVEALMVQRHLATATSETYRAYQRLSSGLRINRAVDDAAGLSIASQLSLTSRLYGQAVRNINDGVSAANIAEGALNISGTSYYLAVDAGDLNGDGKTDLVAAVNGNYFAVALGNGNGTFAATRSYSTSLSSASWDVKLADLNNDGKLDIAAAFSEGKVGYVLGRGDGTFSGAAAPLTLTASPSFVSLDVGDVDRDGDMNIVGTNAADDRLSVFKGNGDGTFTARLDVSSGLDPMSALLADMNTDGLLDIVSADTGSNELSVRLGNGDGTFAQRRTSALDLGTGGVVIRLAAGDFSGDGVVDILAGGSTDGGRDTVYVLKSVSEQCTSMPYLDLQTQSGAKKALITVAQMRSRISLQRGRIGATLSRFDAALATTAASRENFQAAESRIVDADVSEASASLLRSKILQRTSAAILGQVSRGPELALALLRG